MSARAETHQGQGAKQAAPTKRARKKKTCPICGKTLTGTQQEQRYRPFCSKSCADIDLGRWLEGRYAIEGPPVDRAEPGSEPDGDR